MPSHILFTKTHYRQINRRACLDCGRLSYFACFFQEWYGWDITCMRCGRRWSDGEWMSLPFCRTAREDSRNAARRRWKRGLTGPTPLEEL